MLVGNVLTEVVGKVLDIYIITKPIGIRTVEVVDTLRQVGFIRFNKDMIMIIHEAISVTNHRIFYEHFF